MVTIQQANRYVHTFLWQEDLDLVCTGIDPL